MLTLILVFPCESLPDKLSKGNACILLPKIGSGECQTTVARSNRLLHLSEVE